MSATRPGPVRLALVHWRVGLKSVWGQGTTVWVEVGVGFDAQSAVEARRAS